MKDFHIRLRAPRKQAGRHFHLLRRRLQADQVFQENRRARAPASDPGRSQRLRSSRSKNVEPTSKKSPGRLRPGRFPSRPRAWSAEYKQRFQFTIHKVWKLGESGNRLADYLPKTTKDIDQLWETLTHFIAGFENPHLKALRQAFMADPEISAAYRNAPAAKTLHHAYIGSDCSITLLSLFSAPAI